MYYYYYICNVYRDLQKIILIKLKRYRIALTDVSVTNFSKTKNMQYRGAASFEALIYLSLQYWKSFRCQKYSQNVSNIVEIEIYRAYV